MLKKTFWILIFIQITINIFSIEFKIDTKMYFKVQNQFNDYSYLPENGIGDLGYKTQYVKLQINSFKNDYYIFSPYYKLYSKKGFDNFYHYSKFRMFPYKFLVKTINLAEISTKDFLFDTRQLLNNLSDSPIMILQRLFLDKNFLDKNSNIIKNPKDKIFIFLINSSKFSNLLPEGNYINDFFICVYYNEDDLSDEEMIRSITWNDIPMPIGSHYQKYTIYEKSVMVKLKEESNLAKKAEENLYNDLTKEMNKINQKNKIVAEQPKEKQTNQPIVTLKDTTKKETSKMIISPKEEKRITKKIEPILKTKEKEKNPKRIKSESIENNKKKPSPKIKPEGKPIISTEEGYSLIKITIVNKNRKTDYPLREEMNFRLQIKGENLKTPINTKLSDISEVTSVPIEIKSVDYADIIKIFPIIGYSVNGVYADSVFTSLINLNKVRKIKIDLKKLPDFPLILIDKSEILPIEWIGLEPIIKDIKKSVNMKNQYGIFYVNNEKIEGSFSQSISKCYEDYLWDIIYPLATSSGIRMEHLFKLAEKWNKSTYSQRYKPKIHLFLSRATLKSLIAMDNWEMTRKKFDRLKEKFGNAEIVIHSKIKKKDNIPLFKLGLPFRKIK